MSHLYKKFVNEKLIQLVEDIEHIRNCTVIAHIDHGKTTLVDSLIAASGLLSKEVAASARLLDYDMIEQNRGITIKASTISLIHEFDNSNYLIHLVDTPGHIDFSSHVTRGLRLTDGALIVVDAIEGVMVQTETVTRQAMRELVRPSLFINKIDRLIKEKRYTSKKIATEIQRLVLEFNGMLGKYLDDDLHEKWEVSFRNRSLTIGSALDKWGIGLSNLQERAKNNSPSSLANALLETLEDIVDHYAKEEQKELAEKYPVAKVVLNSIVSITPNPKTAQRYRIPSFWRGEIETPIGKALLECDVSGPCVLLVVDVQHDRHTDTNARVRILSGTLVRGKQLRNLRSGMSDKSLQIGISMSKTNVPLQSISAGNLAFISGIKGIAIGDTLTDSEQDFTPFSELQYPTEPVVTYTIEPKKLSDLSTIEEQIQEFVETDPALHFETNPETGEMLLSGAGELHIEISVEKLARTGVGVVLGKPMVVLKEQMSKNGESRKVSDLEGSSFTLKAVLSDSFDREAENVIDSIPSVNCYLIDRTGRISVQSEEFEWISEGFKQVMRYGPVAGERIRGVTILIEDASLKYSEPETSWRDITQPFILAARDTVLSGKPALYEPWLRLEISAPEEYVGILTSILSRRRGQVMEINSERTLYRIDAEIPVAQSFGLANEIRTETSGWATWGAKPGTYKKKGR